ncbi:SH3 domain-containing protein [Planoprotostelium fungivorum]|uniref:SH3 domain-containing protein n=1 Tax=Planoprotostelium fungivorum TaxID=1890364 RepID=A0A2P6NYY8_9EUKA|nr:SH3 domain-containing protein [Planoprotostelium fungivorum]
MSSSYIGKSKFIASNMTFAELTWDSFDSVKAQTKTTTAFREDFVKTLEKLNTLSASYAKGLQALSKTKLPNTVDGVLYSTVKSAWGGILENIEQMGTVIFTFSEDVQRVVDSVNRQEKDRVKPMKSLMTQGKSLLTELKKCEVSTAKAKEKYVALKKKHEESMAEYMTAKDTQAATVVSKLGKKADTDGKAEEKADKELHKSVEVLRSCQEKVFLNDMPSILLELEKMESERIDLVRIEMGNVCEAESRAAPSIKSISDKLSNTVHNINPRTDLLGFAERICTGRQLVLATYQNVNDPLGGPSSSGSYPPPAAAGSSRNLNATASSGSLKEVHATANANVTATANASGGTKEQVVSLYAYEAAESNELSFPAHAQISVLSKDESGWWQGEYNGKIGIFPYNFVEPAGVSSTSTTPREVSTIKGGRYQALYDYTAQDEEELSFTAGETFKLESESEGWLFVTNEKGQFGRIPSTYTTEMQ